MSYTILSKFLSLLARLSLLCMLAISSAWAGETQLEILFLPHRPAIKVADEAENIARQFNNVSIRRYSLDDAASHVLVQKYGLTDHLPIAIFINGQNQFMVNGKVMRFVNFPKSDAFIPGFAGEWDYADLKAVLGEFAK